MIKIILTRNFMKYSETLMDHFKKPRNQGSIKDADAIGEVGNIKCGDMMKIYIKVEKGATNNELATNSTNHLFLYVTKGVHINRNTARVGDHGYFDCGDTTGV